MAGMNKFTQKAKRVLSIAQQEAETEQAREIGSEHLLLGLCIETGTAANRVLEDLGVETSGVRAVLEEMRSKEEQIKNLSPVLGEDMKRLLEQALAESMADKATTVGTEHLILAMSRDEYSMAMRILASLGITPEQVQRQTARIMEEYKRMQDVAKKPEASEDLEKSDVISRRGVSAVKKKRKARLPWWISWQPI